MSIVHVESVILPLGHVVERLANDYGYDLRLITFNEGGFLEPDHVLIQVKATDNPKFLANGSALSFELERKHLWTWSRELSPIILILYDASEGEAYWRHLTRTSLRELTQTNQGTCTVHLSSIQIFDAVAATTIRQIKNDLVAFYERQTNDD
ncbi:DUF4365 domain-containing protein [Armatimonas sp.]|uniref:DUF4365 domain-containing protein n=1 Tax=Armatimonas sp. TaxID=1872638 RepID=UPI003751E222